LRDLLTPKNLRKYQWKAIRFALKRLFCALFMDMGLGKTVSVLSVLKALIHHGKLDKPVLLIGPIRVIYTVWAQEAAVWSHTRKLTFSIVHGNVRQRLAALDMPADVYLINPENIVWLLTLLKTNKAVNDWPFGALVVDESSMFKSAGTKRFGKLRHFIHLFKRRIILSGTPTPNSLLEIWTQMFIVDGGERLGTSFNRFKDRFFTTEDPDDPGNAYADYPRLVPRRGSEEYIYDLIGDVALSMEADDYLELPETIVNPVHVNLPDEAKAIYDRFEREMFLEMDQGDVTALNAAVLSMKCQQISNGAIYTVERETGAKIWEHIHDAKLNALEEILYETGTPVLVAYYFKHDLARLLKRYPNAPFFKAARDDKLEREWNEGKHRIAFAHPASAAHGMNLQYGPGHTIAFFSLTWSYERYKQLIARIGLARAQRKVMVHHIIGHGTVDHAIMDAMQHKAHGNRALMNALKEYRNVRQTSAQTVFPMGGQARRSPRQQRSRTT